MVVDVEAAAASGKGIPSAHSWEFFSCCFITCAICCCVRVIIDSRSPSEFVPGRSSVRCLSLRECGHVEWILYSRGVRSVKADGSCRRMVRVVVCNFVNNLLLC